MAPAAEGSSTVGNIRSDRIGGGESARVGGARVGGFRWSGLELGRLRSVWGFGLGYYPGWLASPPPVLPVSLLRTTTAGGADSQGSGRRLRRDGFIFRTFLCTVALSTRDSGVQLLGAEATGPVKIDLTVEWARPAKYVLRPNLIFIKQAEADAAACKSATRPGPIV